MSSQEENKNEELYGFLGVVVICVLVGVFGRGCVSDFMSGVNEGLSENRQVSVVRDAWNETVGAYNRATEAVNSAQTLEYARRAAVRFKNELLAVDVSECPSDFQAAFQDLLAAVDRAIATYAQLNGDAGFGGVLEGVGTALFDDPDMYVNDAIRELKYVAQRHGVKIRE
ncbi:MAG: hypothetical protein J6K20_14335 [Thermoguttaceae bacterium]|nr:hypothetical protein [Thermoguttaceae bacterium]